MLSSVSCIRAGLISSLLAHGGYRDSGTPNGFEAWIVYGTSKRSLCKIPLSCLKLRSYDRSAKPSSDRHKICCFSTSEMPIVHFYVQTMLSACLTIRK